METLQLHQLGGQVYAFAYPGGTAHITYHDGGRLSVQLEYAAAYGTGERYNALNQKGLSPANQVEEKFCNQGDKTYCPAPFFYTDTGFGLCVDTDLVFQFHFGDEIVIDGLPAETTLRLFSGKPAEIIAEYMRLGGAAKLPPKWAFGPWISANHWDSGAKTEQQIAMLKAYGFPATAIVLEAWSDEATFYIFNGAKYTPVAGEESLDYDDFDFSASPWPDPKGMIERLHENGLHLLLWQIPVYKKQGAEEAPCAQNDNDRAHAEKSGLAVCRKDGEVYTIPAGNWFGGSMIPDFTNPETRRLWFAKRQYLLDIGVDGFKTDGGEFVYRQDLHFACGATGAEMKNGYAQSYTTAYTRFLPENGALFSRAGYKNGHTTPMLWAGDQQSTWAELQSQLRAGLSAAASGIPFWGFDIGGFAGPLPDPALYMRATQLACFVPVMQWHSEPDGGQFREIQEIHLDNNERSPWNIAELAEDTEAYLEELRFYHTLRMNLLPYIYSEAIGCTRHNRPLMRPLAYQWPEDVQVVAIEDQFLLGESLLLAPVLAPENTRQVYLPAGTWYSFDGAQSYQGGRWITEDGGDGIPLYVRGGCALALNLGEQGVPGLSLATPNNPLGNRVNGYENLHLWLYGPAGSYHFADDLGNNFTVHWQNEKAWLEGKADSELHITLLP